jgi:hypothetical protein
MLYVFFSESFVLAAQPKKKRGKDKKEQGREARGRGEAGVAGKAEPYTTRGAHFSFSMVKLIFQPVFRLFEGTLASRSGPPDGWNKRTVPFAERLLDN